MSTHVQSRGADAGAYALVVGEALVDEVLSGGESVSHPGGSPYNVAIGLARLGVRTLLHTAVGDDQRGALLREHARASALALTAESLTADPTSFARADIDSTGAAIYDFTVTWRPTPFLAAAVPRVLHVGSVSAAMPPGRDLVAGVVSGLRPTSIISLDPNVRPRLTADRDATRWRIEELVTLADVVKVSDEDLEWLHPRRDIATVAAEWLARGPDLVVVTRGALGAVGFSQWGSHECVAPLITVVDTIGAGDSFSSGLLCALMTAGVSAAGGRLSRFTSDQVDQSLRFAAECAAVTVSRAGAQPPWKSELG